MKENQTYETFVIKSQTIYKIGSLLLMNQDMFKVGDQVRVTTRNPQDNKVHATPFVGVVIALRGTGTGRTFTVRKIADGKVAVERIFPLASPIIENVKVIKSGKFRRAKLYYLRNK